MSCYPHVKNKGSDHSPQTLHLHAWTAPGNGTDPVLIVCDAVLRGCVQLRGICHLQFPVPVPGVCRGPWVGGGQDERLHPGPFLEVHHLLPAACPGAPSSKKGVGNISLHFVKHVPR